MLCVGPPPRLKSKSGESETSSKGQVVCNAPRAPRLSDNTLFEVTSRGLNRKGSLSYWHQYKMLLSYNPFLESFPFADRIGFVKLVARPSLISSLFFYSIS